MSSDFALSRDQRGSRGHNNSDCRGTRLSNRRRRLCICIEPFRLGLTTLVPCVCLPKRRVATLVTLCWNAALTSCPIANLVLPAVGSRRETSGGGLSYRDSSFDREV